MAGNKFSADSLNHLDRRNFLTTAAQLAGLATASAVIPSMLLPSRAWAAEGTPTSPVATRSGKVRGLSVDSVHAFKGIPYGAPTGAERRFMPPARDESWTNVRDAFEFGNYAPQSSRQRGAKQLEFFSVLRPASNLKSSEDCLYLNVWTKGVGDGGKRPVMVWFHGGGFDQGSGGSIGYDGAALAKHQDVVTVTVNHRLNVLGYLFLGDVGGSEFENSANLGQQDLVASLQWVRDNISAFGGDPGNVMIFGQSGGGAKVSTLLGMPSAKGLFRTAVIQSGAALRGMTRETANPSAESLLKQFGLAKGQARELQKVPLDKLMAAASGMRNGPVVDGKVLPANPFDPVATQISADVPVMVGYTRTERTVYMIDDPAPAKIDDAALLSSAKQTLGDDAERVIASYRQKYPQASPADLSLFISSDAGAMSSIHLAERRAALGKAPTFLYVFAWETPVMGLRAPHTIEIPFVFNHIDTCQSMVGPINPKMKELELQTAGAWASLARSGKPTHAGLPNWPAYTSDTRSVMIFDAPCRVENDPTKEVRQILEKKNA